MAILSKEKYLIHCAFYDSPESKGAEEPQLYFGTLEDLKKTIATTWSQIPHEVIIQHNTVHVQREKGTVLANFTFTSLTSQELPDHF